jgi:hypothetical protein
MHCTQELCESAQWCASDITTERVKVVICEQAATGVLPWH